MKKLPHISQYFQEFAEKYWAKIIFDEEYFYAWKIIYKNWKVGFFSTTSFDVNSLWASKIAKDKSYTKTFLKKFWYKVPEWQVFFSDELNFKVEDKKSIDDGFLYAKKLWFPVIVKPNNLSQWKYVWKIFNKQEYFSLAKKILKETDTMIIERFCEWNDYRIVVFDWEVFLCYERKSLSIIWDWEKNIEELINDKNDYLKSTWRNARINIEKTNLIKNLKRKKYTLQTILKKSEKLRLLDNANLSTWWELIEHIHDIHDDYKKLAIDILKNMWLRYWWIDILTQDISKPIWDYNILEINASPWFNNYLLWWEKNLELAKNLCQKIFLAMWE